MKEWRQKALSSEAKASELQARMFVLHEEVERLRNERERKTARGRYTSPANQEARTETEKQILVCGLKENRCANDDGCKAQTCTAAGLLPRQSPLRELGNMSALMKQHAKESCRYFGKVIKTIGSQTYPVRNKHTKFLPRNWLT